METSDGRLLRGQRTRDEILETAASLASLEGLEGLTIGRLAKEIGMSKSGLFAHFGSKADLQLAVVDWAAGIFRERIILPLQDLPAGLPRIRRLIEQWLDYLHGEVFPGGCFFYAAAAEFDGRPGAVRRRIAELMKLLLDYILREIRRAQKRGQLDRQADPEQLTFEIHALMQEANWSYQLLERPNAFDLARKAVEERLDRLGGPAEEGS